MVRMFFKASLHGVKRKQGGWGGAQSAPPFANTMSLSRVLRGSICPLMWRFRFIIHLKHALSCGDSGSSYILNMPTSLDDCDSCYILNTPPHVAIPVHPYMLSTPPSLGDSSYSYMFNTPPHMALPVHHISES